MVLLEQHAASSQTWRWLHEPPSRAPPLSLHGKDGPRGRSLRQCSSWVEWSRISWPPSSTAKMTQPRSPNKSEDLHHFTILLVTKKWWLSYKKIGGDFLVTITLTSERTYKHSKSATLVTTFCRRRKIPKPPRRCQFTMLLKNCYAVLVTKHIEVPFG